MVINARGSVFAVTGSFPRAAVKPGRKPFKRHQYATNKQRNALGSLQRELFALAAFFWGDWQGREVSGLGWGTKAAATDLESPQGAGVHPEPGGTSWD